ncbi:hypothetical protein M3223_16105 [Paenibacillus pasadenensis]|uniref:hypothetical protein n=1 Tax=Paenibacillus pasadenensis TaxID=217090 RepID=UPI00203B8D6E|nr:hypothetical protein [Paenibacillus pasadenensis]MCM3748878.1 hypothetical protein [Paenibacillus pasadenensis]
MLKVPGNFVSSKLFTAMATVLFILLLFCFANSAKAAPATIVNNTDWFDTDGNKINAQGGWMMQEGNTFYWYGFDISRKAEGIKEIKLYTSTDFKSWTNQGNVVDFSGFPADFAFSDWIGRLVVAYNSSTSKYVMLMEWNTLETGTRNRLVYLTSSSIDGPFTYNKYDEKPGGYKMGDLGGIFKDDDGSTYITFTSDVTGQNDSLKIGKLAANYLSIESTMMTWGFGNVREASSLIKVGSNYLLSASEAYYYQSTPTRYSLSTSLSSGWSKSGGDMIKMPTSPTTTNSFDSQHDQIFPIHGTNGTIYVYLGDRWSNMANGSQGVGKNMWFPVTFDSNGTPTLNGYSSWTIDAAAGTWSPVVTTQSLFSDNFEDGNAQGWTGITGAWSIVTDATFAYKQSTNTATEAVTTTGNANWTDYDVRADVNLKSTASGAATGIIGRYKDNNNYYLLRLSTNQVQLLKKVNGTFSTVASKPYTVNLNTVYNLKLSMKGGSLVGSVNGVEELTVSDSSLTTGKIGFRAYSQAATFDNVQVVGVQ